MSDEPLDLLREVYDQLETASVIRSLAVARQGRPIEPRPVLMSPDWYDRAATALLSS